MFFQLGCVLKSCCCRTCSRKSVRRRHCRCVLSTWLFAEVVLQPQERPEAALQVCPLLLAVAQLYAEVVL